MAPGADVGGAANRQIGDGGSVALRAGVKVSQVKDMNISPEKKGENQDQAPVLSARERLRLHVNRNLALQQETLKSGCGIDKGPASAGGPPVPPRGASPGKLWAGCHSLCRILL
jgi:hypothetical protein